MAPHMKGMFIPSHQLPPGFAEALDRPVPHPVDALPAATVVLVREGDVAPEVLLLRRHRASGFVPGAYVFPGGRVDPGDEDARLHERVVGLQTAEPAFGYWMAADCQGRGLVTEAIRVLLDFGFGPAGLHRVQAAIMPRNARSLRVIEKLGFRREGYAERYLQIAGKWEDHIIFARTREEHVPSRE